MHLARYALGAGPLAAACGEEDWGLLSIEVQAVDCKLCRALAYRARVARRLRVR